MIFNTSSERPLSKAFRINIIGPAELKLWPFKDVYLTLGPECTR